MTTNKKWIKIAGNIITLLAIFFIVRRLTTFDIDYVSLLRTSLIPTLILSALFGAHMFVLCLPWKVIIEILASIRAPFSEASWILNKSNLLKYLPGNVFQYIGRNELALRLGIEHFPVAFATICDVGMLIFANLAMATLVYGKGVLQWSRAYGVRLSFVFIAMTVLGLALVVLYFFKRNWLMTILRKIRPLFLGKSIFKLLGCFAFYLAITLFVAFLFLCIFRYILFVPVAPALYPAIMGAYMLSWTAGFIMPGAPGGIGVREAAMTLLLTGFLTDQDALLAAVIFRFITVLGDFWGILFAGLFHRFTKKLSPS
jgi:uncharacterized membrane protein YbhN (UPF0104 family)